MSTHGRNEARVPERATEDRPSTPASAQDAGLPAGAPAASDPARPGTGPEHAYRPEIDGLRAIAVGSVLLHHLSQGLLPGGYVGVDIFFVISGFLITAQLYGSGVAGRLSLREFYKRRINRIVPALATVVTACLVAGLLLMSPADLVRLVQTGALSLVGLSNIFIWREYGQYFAADAREAILLHTWSLGVEEQFYFVWPALMALCLRRRVRWLLPAMGVLTLASLAVSELGTRTIASASYYLLPTRFFELAIGGVLAVASAGRPAPSRAVAIACQALGLAALAWALATLTPASRFPGLAALAPCLGTALLIHGGRARSPITAALTWRPVVFIGLVSYSLYLWHWPLIAFLSYLDIPMTPLLAATVVAAATTLAWATWRWVEVPWRRSGARLSAVQVVMRRLLVPAALAGVATAATLHWNGYPSRYPPEVERLQAMSSARADELRRGCHVPTALYRTPPDLSCRLGVHDGAPPDGALVGDSFANHFTGMLDVMAAREGLRLVDYTMDGCPPIAGWSGGLAPGYAAKCVARNEAWLAWVAQQRFRRVVLGASWPRDEAAGPAIERTLERVEATGAQVVVLLDNPGLRHAASCPVRAAMYRTAPHCEGPPAPRPAYWHGIAARHPGVRFIDPDPVLCPGGTCRALIDGTLMYRDDGHLNDIGSRLIGKRLADAGVTLAGGGARP